MKVLYLEWNHVLLRREQRVSEEHGFATGNGQADWLPLEDHRCGNGPGEHIALKITTAVHAKENAPDGHRGTFLHFFHLNHFHHDGNQENTSSPPQLPTHSCCNELF